MRFDDSPELFGVGVGSSTSGDITCAVCGTRYNEGADDDQCFNDVIGETEFAGKTVCSCCFEEIENEVLRRMPDILSWYRRIVEARKKRLMKDDESLKELGA